MTGLDRGSEEAPAPPISVVIPAHEAAELFAAAVESALAQQDVDFEVVVVDDSATDAIARVLRRREGAGARLRAFPGARTGNPVDNWNLGLDLARGPIKVLLHQDDRIADPLFLSRCVETLAPAGVVAGVAGSRVVGVERPSRMRWVRWVGATPARVALLPLVNWIGSTGAFPFKGAHRFDARLRWLVDVEFYGRVLSSGAFVRVPGEGLLCLGHHAGSISSSLDISGLWRAELAQWAAQAPQTLPPWRARLFAELVRMRSLVRG